MLFAMSLTTNTVAAPTIIACSAAIGRSGSQLNILEDEQPRRTRWNPLDVLIRPLVVYKRRARRAQPHRLDRTKEHVVACHLPHLHDAAVEGNHCRGQYRTARAEHRPI